MLEVEIIKESLMVLSGTNIIFLLVTVAFYCEGGLWKMFGDEAFGKARPRREVASVDGVDEGIFDGAEGFSVEVFGEFTFGCVISENAVGLEWMGTC